jgi:hypothetical protein
MVQPIKGKAALEGAKLTKEIIASCYVQGIIGLQRSTIEGSIKRQKYWIERLIHLIDELNWIDRFILNERAAANEESLPPTQYP